VYGDNAMSDGMVRKWVRMFIEGRENVHDEARNGRPSLVNDDLVRKVNERVRDDRRFTVSDLSLQFPQISKTLLYDNASSHLGYRKVRARWVPKMLTEEHKKQRVACALTFVMCYHKEGDGMLNHILTGDETWVSHITPESVLALEAYWLADAVQKWLTSQAPAFYEEGIQNLVSRYDKYLNNGGEYVEK